MAQEFVKAQIKGDKVVVFLKPSCPYCVMAKDVLSKYKLKNGHLDLIDISGRSDMGSIQDYLQQITGARTVSISSAFFACGKQELAWQTFCHDFKPPNLLLWKLCNWTE